MVLLKLTRTANVRQTWAYRKGARIRMDWESDLGVQAEKPDNLVWVEEVILNNLDLTCDPLDRSGEPCSSISSENKDNQEETESSELQPETKPEQNETEKPEMHEPKIAISEIEMRDENYFGDDRVNTLSRLVGARIKFVVDGETEERNHFWILKIPSVLTQERELAKAIRVYEKEICFYTEILPAMKSWIENQNIDELIEFKVPTCFYGKYLRNPDPEPDPNILDHILQSESLLVLEDLRALEYGKCYLGKGMEISEVFAAVEEIVKFHAVSHAMQVKLKEPLQWKELTQTSDFLKLYEVLFHRGFESFKNFMSNRPDDPESAGIMKAMTRLNSRIGKILARLIAPSKNFPTTLIHMDLWSDNLLFRVKDEDRDMIIDEADLDCMIIDWQMVAMGKPSHDISLLMILSMDGEQRRNVSHLILQYYHDLFAKTLSWFDVEMPFNFETLIMEFSDSCLLAMIMAVCSMDLVLMEESTQNRLLEVIKDLMCDGILRQ